MQNTKKEFKKDVATFLHLCKDLYTHIKRKLVNQYVYPKKEDAEIKNEAWKYYKSNEILTDEEKILDIYKDNNFLLLVQNCFKCLNEVITKLEENKSNVECLNKELEIGEHKIKILS